MRRSLVILFFLLPVSIAGAAERYAGRTLADALRVLESKGLRIVYSDEVVTPSMIVRSEPVATQPRRILDELLREHGLTVKDGPRKSLLIVRKDNDPARSEPSEPSAPPPVMPVTIEKIVVTPSQYEMLGSEPEQRQFLDRDEVRRVPHISDDFHRAIRHVPGAASDDITARFKIRGGDEDEVVVLIDGAEIYDPFHVRDMVRAFSTIDVEAVSSVDILTGGFPAQFGGRMSGVIDISTLAPTETRTEIGVSLLNLRFLSQGVIQQGRGQWMLSVRRGYLHELLELVDSTNDVDPRYYDLLGKVQWTLGDSNILSLHAHGSHDRIRVDQTANQEVGATYDDRYVWLNLRSSPTPAIFTQSVVSYGTFSRDRGGTYHDDQEQATLKDQRDLSFAGVRNDSSFRVTPRNLIKAGLNARRFNSRFDYDAHATIFPDALDLGGGPKHIDRSAHLNVRSTEMGAYLSNRLKVTEHLVLEAGARWDSESHTSDGSHVSPRLNAAWAISETSSLRAAWGLFYQPQLVHELQVEDGVTTFPSAQRSEHRVIGLDHRFGRGFTLRAEAYDKVISSPRPRFENIYDRIIFFPELRYDRVRIAPTRSNARGMELLLGKSSGGPVTGWINYSLASVTDELDGREVPRGWDQRHAFNFSVNYKHGEKWNFNIAGTLHTGWPTTPLLIERSGETFDSQLGPLFSKRLPSYRRLDFRAARNVAAARGTVSFFVDLFNVLGTSNITSVSSFAVVQNDSGSLDVFPNYDPVVGVVPSFGISWQF